MRTMSTHSGLHRTFGESLRYPLPEEDSPARRVVARLLDLRHIGWDIGVRAMEKASGHRRGEPLDFKLSSSARDLLSTKSRAVRDEVEALTEAVMRAGSYPAREEGIRALHAVLDAVRDRVPRDVLLKLSEHLPEAEAARLRASMGEKTGAEDKPV
ncbi:MAG: DUF2267 domain-containing protein [Thermoleophilia bacterium]|jgi:hypothetical protein|nr:DUF2267 domain-containing protein [Thermoleophilia bacterium]